MKATQVGCQACKQKGKSKFNGILIAGFITLGLMIYGLVSLIYDLYSLF